MPRVASVTEALTVPADREAETLRPVTERLSGTETKVKSPLRVTKPSMARESPVPRKAKKGSGVPKSTGSAKSEKLAVWSPVVLARTARSPLRVSAGMPVRAAVPSA
ncbi:MAG: hypothetical protein P5697_01675 [Limnospira sp. PMC 1256.20]|uniref:hypothetical protein n=1 Tax=Limnospira sp. PMC 1256.20 TaxID=2981054 RepID=UPI0028E0B9BC|nr:hypothetical protein [Limnospira sp. PMC 1256.20]MDT9212176.1 hypothetical protein [Limnospira sp. PMC 1256.20]